jgi:glycosyltransferase involved in cell wall biosynthesis
MSVPLVQFLLPVYNAADTLPRALDSLIMQSFDNWECIAVDDGSVDASANILAEYEKRDARFRCIHIPHSGIVHALNVGIDYCSAPLIARMDADDENLPRRLELQVNFLHEHPEIGVVSCMVEHKHTDSNQHGYEQYVAWTNSLITPEDHFLNRFIESPLAHPTVVFRSVLARYKDTYREKPCWPEDYELWLRWMHEGVKFAKVPEVLYRWTDIPHRLSRSDPRYSVEAFYACKTDYLVKGPLAHTPEIGVWGSGRITRKRVELLEQFGYSIKFYVDINPKKIGQHIHGVPVIAPEELPNMPDIPLLAYVGSRGARDAIRGRLNGTRYVEGENFWCVA